MKWYVLAIRKYGEFVGRASREEYWMFVLFNLIFSVTALMLDYLLGTTITDIGYGFIYIFYGLFVLIPGLAAAVRRLHDVGKSGWMILISLIPLVGSIWLIVLLATDSVPGENEYGPNPKETSPTATIINSSTADSLILAIVIWMVFARLFWVVMPLIFDNPYSTNWFRIVNSIFSFIWAFIPIGLALAVKNKSIQIALFIIGGLYVIYGLFESISQLIKWNF